jgi:hypothetical protein
MLEIVIFFIIALIFAFIGGNGSNSIQDIKETKNISEPLSVPKLQPRADNLFVEKVI